MFIGGYDTDDLTNRQYHYVCKLGKTTAIAMSFMKYCIKMNIILGTCENYPGDCDWLLSQNPVLLAHFGIDVNNIYN